MELFNAIFETFWTFSGTVILVSIIGSMTAATFHGAGRLSLIKIGKIDKSMNKKINETKESK